MGDTNLMVAASIPPMSEGAIGKVRLMETIAAQAPQVDIDTHHIIHGGMYARTIKVPAGVMITGALIKIATILMIHGDVVMYVGDESRTLTGYNVLTASAFRKQAFLAISDVFMTMVFPTDAQDIASAEEEFTDETHLLISRKKGRL